MSALVDRVYAMNVGRRSLRQGCRSDGERAVRKVYLGGRSTAARPEASFVDAQTPFLEMRILSVVYDKAEALRASRCTCIPASSSPSRTERRRQDDPCST